MIHSKVYDIERNIMGSKNLAVEYAAKRFLEEFNTVTEFSAHIKVTLYSYIVVIFWEETND